MQIALFQMNICRLTRSPIFDKEGGIWNCQNPNSTTAHSSIQQSLRLDYVLTVISTTPPGTLYVVVVLNCPASSRQRLVCTTVQVSGTLHIWASNFVLFKIIGFWKFWPQNPKIFGLRTEGLFIGPSKSLWKVKKEVVDEFGYLFFCV